MRTPAGFLFLESTVHKNYEDIKYDNLLKNLEILMPDLIRHPERIVFTGFPDKSESSTGLVVIPDPDPGRNDGKENFSTFTSASNLICRY